MRVLGLFVLLLARQLLACHCSPTSRPTFTSTFVPSPPPVAASTGALETDPQGRFDDRSPPESPYDPNCDCWWHIDVTDTNLCNEANGDHIYLYIDRFEAETGCDACDHLDMFDFMTVDPLAVPGHVESGGSPSTSYVEFPGCTATFHWVTDSTVQGWGWQVSYIIKRGSTNCDCWGVVDEKNHQSASFFYGSFGPGGGPCDCVWVIDPDHFYEDQIIQLDVVSLGIDAGDYIKVYNDEWPVGGTYDGSNIATISSTDVVPYTCQVTPGRSAFLYWHTDTYNQQSWQINYSVNPSGGGPAVSMEWVTYIVYLVVLVTVIGGIVKTVKKAKAQVGQVARKVQNASGNFRNQNLTGAPPPSFAGKIQALNPLSGVLRQQQPSFPAPQPMQQPSFPPSQPQTHQQQHGMPQGMVGRQGIQNMLPPGGRRQNMGMMGQQGMQNMPPPGGMQQNMGMMGQQGMQNMPPPGGMQQNMGMMGQHGMQNMPPPGRMQQNMGMMGQQGLQIMPPQGGPPQNMAPQGAMQFEMPPDTQL